MLRLFVARARSAGDRLRIGGAELRHLRVHRLRPGDHLVVFDDAGTEHEVRLERMDARGAEGRVLATRRPARESTLELVLAPALTKGARMDLVVEKATELGVTRLAPVLTRRAVATGARVERWRRIAVAAAKQSGRTLIPVVTPPVPLASLVRAAWPGLRLVAWEGERETGFGALPPHAAAVVVVVGPEGGLTDDEVADARAHGFVPLTLAPRVLRAETAALVATALCQHRWGDLSSNPPVR